MKSNRKILFNTLLFALSCLPFGLLGQDRAPEQKSYLFVGHCYQIGSGGTRVDYRLEALDLSVYDGIWLGGDVCSEAMLDFETVIYIDSLFNLGNPDTHWALGNHDARNGNWEWYEALGGRKTFYTYSADGVVRIILNTNLVPTNCEDINDQFEQIVSVCDTISSGNNLVLLMHHGIWRDVPGLPNPGNYAQSDLVYWNANCYEPIATFAEAVYPLLVGAHQRDVNVYCILGDMGSGKKSIDYLSDDGIHFLGCGFHHNEAEDKVLILNVDPSTRALNYNYHRIDSLVDVQRISQ